KHYMKYFVTASTGVSNFPEFVGALVVDDIQTGYCDSNKKRVETKQDWMRKIFEDDPQHFEHYARECLDFQPNFSKAMIYHLQKRFNQSRGVHILQERCLAVSGTMRLEEAVITKQRWDEEKARLKFNENYLTQICPLWLKKYLTFAKSSLLRTDLPSVSLLQKSPSSPVSCHATGFYPDRATLIWRKDGEELHEDVDHGEILPNHDGSFQMSVDLKLSSVTPEDWSRYDCVFHLSGVKDDIVTKLDKAEIRTNWEKPSNMIIPIIAAVAVLAVVLMAAAAGFIIYKKKKAKSPPHDLPSVSLLQKSPSSPVSCHATGFYPDRATLIWRKDGEELHEDVDHGEILPNHDGSFQMSVDLKLSSVTPDLRDLEQVSTIKMVCNWSTEKPSNMIIPIIAAVAVLAVVLMAAAGFILYKKKKGIKKAKKPFHMLLTTALSSLRD
ncbi:hypothetical protein L3Q82_015250, partial [Scortum barcoo]